MIVELALYSFNSIHFPSCVLRLQNKVHVLLQLLSLPFVIMKCPFLVIPFVLTSISSINLAAPAALYLQFVSDTFLTYFFGHICAFIVGVHLL